MAVGLAICTDMCFFLKKIESMQSCVCVVFLKDF